MKELLSPYTGRPAVGLRKLRIFPSLRAHKCLILYWILRNGKKLQITCTKDARIERSRIRKIIVTYEDELLDEEIFEPSFENDYIEKI